MVNVTADGGHPGRRAGHLAPDPQGLVVKDTANAPARSELILGGQKSGKSRRAELLARDWLAQSAQHRAVMIATAQAWDAEMVQRIAGQVAALEQALVSGDDCDAVLVQIAAAKGAMHGLMHK